jgi:hypothetical protein
MLALLLALYQSARDSSKRGPGSVVGNGATLCYIDGTKGGKPCGCFDQCGHVPPVEKSKEFVSTVDAFLSDAGATPR